MTPVAAHAREIAFAFVRGAGCFGVLLFVGSVLRATGLWQPDVPSDWLLVAATCALSLALWQHWPVAHLLLVTALVINPWSLFAYGQVRVVPLVIAAYLTARAGLTLWMSLPVVTIGVLLSQYPGWHSYVRRPPELLWDYLMYAGFSQQFLTLALTVAAVLLGRAAHRRERAATELRARNEELIRLRHADRLRIESEARTAIAREVHDVVAHHMAALVVRAQAAALVAERDPAAARAAIDWIAEAGPQALAEMRGLVRVLRAGDADGRNPVRAAEAIRTMADRVRASGVEVDTRLAIPDGLAPVAEFALVRVCQEALTNALVHSGARLVTVRVSCEDGTVRLVVDDDGECGRTVGSAAAMSSNGGSGLPGMRERATAAGGTVTAGPTATGWRVDLTVPAPASIR